MVFFHVGNQAAAASLAQLVKAVALVHCATAAISFLTIQIPVKPSQFLPGPQQQQQQYFGRVQTPMKPDRLLPGP